MLSELWKRILLLVTAALLVSFIISSALFVLFTKDYFVSLKAQELIPQAYSIGDSMLSLGMKEVTDDHELFGKAGEQTLFAAVFAVDKNKKLLYWSGRGMDSVPPDEFLANIDELVSSALSGQEVIYVGQHTLPSTLLFVGVPVKDGPSTAGAVFMIKPVTEVNTAMNGFYTSLLIALLITLPLMYIAASLISRRITRPLNRMRNVAMQLAAGNFAANANEDQSGELGQLAYALNHLSRELQFTISELTLERNRLQFILNGLTEGIAAIDASNEPTQANPAVYRLFGLPVPETLPRDLSAILPLPRAQELLRGAVGKSEPEANDIHTRGGRIIRMTAIPLYDEKGAPAGAMALLQDITQSELLEQTRRDYVANVSHELRTPLTAMRGLIEPLRDGLVDDDKEARSRYYEIILRETLRLSRLIDDLLSLSRLQSGNVSITPAYFNLTGLLQDISQHYGDTAKDKSIEVVCDAPPLTAYANEDRVEQLVIILLDNAIKFTPENGRITVAACEDDGKIYVEVSDTGPGIVEEDLAHIFERFYKADKSRHQGGTGLGLSIAAEIIRLMNQQITAENLPEGGACFRFTLDKDEKNE